MPYTDDQTDSWEGALGELADTAYKVGDIVTVRVERVSSSAAVVRFDNGTEGYIRPRDLTLSANVDPRNVLTVGQTIRAMVIKPGLPGRRPELSLRRLEPDPWPAFVARHHLGDVIPVTVKHVYAEHVLVEHLPGLDGHIPIDELTSGERPAHPENMLKAGDRTEGVIIYLDKNRRRLILSVRRWADRLATTDALLDVLAGADRHIDTELPAELIAQRFTPGPIEPAPLPGPILIVEDEEDIRRSLQARLQNDGYEVIVAALAQEALERCDERAFALALIDIDMPGMDGLELIARLAERRIATPVFVMSAPDLIDQKRGRLDELGVDAYFDKPLDMDKLQQSLRRLVGGESLPPTEREHDNHEPEVPLPAEASSFRTLAASLRTESGTERLRLGLEQLTKSTQADVGILFHLDLETRTTKILADAGLPPINPEDLYRLPESPVKDVIVDEEIVLRHRVSADRSGRFRNLTALFPFESCIGIPLEVGGRIAHALFLFAHAPDVFTANRLREAMAAAVLFQSVLESQLLDERILSTSQLLLAGRITSAITHEVSGKVMALDQQISNMRTGLGWVLEGDLDKGVPEIGRWLGDMAKTMLRLRETMETLIGLKAGSQQGLVDVARALNEAALPVALEAQRSKVRVHLAPDAELPPAVATAPRVHHVFVNLLLNAVQWTKSLPDRAGRVHVGASLVEIDGAPWIRVRFTDNGPGIHHSMWDRIFVIGVTTREEGSGLGLYIARSLIESMGGRLYVENSLMLLGTTFAVELPAARE